MFRPCLTNGHGILKSKDGRSLWIGIEFLEGARLRGKLRFVVRNRALAVLNRGMDGVGRARVEHVFGTSVTSPWTRRGFKGSSATRIPVLSTSWTPFAPTLITFFYDTFV